MRRGLVRSVFTVAALLLLFPLAAPARAESGGATTRYIVTLDGAGDVAATAAGLLEELGAGTLVDTYEHALDGFVVDLPSLLAPALAALPGVAGIEPDGVFTVSTTQPDAPWGLDRVDQRQRPLDTEYTYDFSGAGVDAYIIDTGIHGTHTEYASRVEPGVNTVDGSPSTSDCNGHGSHVAGTVGGSTYGVAKDVTLIAVRVFGCGTSTPTSAIIDGVDWVVGHHLAGQPAVANMSLGGGASAALDAAVRAMIGDGVVTAIASGNETTNGCNSSPGRVSEGLTTGATSINDGRAGFSNWGSCVDVHAPGVDIESASPSSNSATATLSGTSMAAPHVAGAAALYLDEFPGALPSTVHAAIVDSATTGAISGIKTNCTFLDNLLGQCMAGTPNRLLFVDFDAEPPSPPPPPPPPSCSALERLLGLC